MSYNIQINFSYKWDLNKSHLTLNLSIRLNVKDAYKWYNWNTIESGVKTITPYTSDTNISEYGTEISFVGTIIFRLYVYTYMQSKSTNGIWWKEKYGSIRQFHFVWQEIMYLKKKNLATPPPWCLDKHGSSSVFVWVWIF